MPLWLDPLICCPTAHYFPNDIWDATVKGTERSISPAFQSNLLLEGNNMSISKRGVEGLEDPLSECGLGAGNRKGSGWRWESFSIFLQKVTFATVKFGSDFILSWAGFWFEETRRPFRKWLCENRMKTIFAGWKILRTYLHQVRALLNPAQDLPC